jgi:hypothetical protein
MTLIIQALGEAFLKRLQVEPGLNHKLIVCIDHERIVDALVLT